MGVGVTVIREINILQRIGVVCVVSVLEQGIKRMSVSRGHPYA